MFTSALPTLRQLPRAQWALLDLNCRRAIGVGTAGPQPGTFRAQSGPQPGTFRAQ